MVISGKANVVVVDPSTGGTTSIAALISGYAVVDGSAYDPVGHRYFAYGGCLGNCLFTIDVQTGSVTSATIPDAIFPANPEYDVVTGTIYAIHKGSLVQINPTTAVETTVATLGSNGFATPYASGAFDVVGRRYLTYGTCPNNSANFCFFTVYLPTPTVSSFEITFIPTNLQYASPPLQITTMNLPHDVSGQPYATTFTAAGGTGTGYVWALASGSSLPMGFTLSSSGALSSTGGQALSPASSYTFTVTVTDSSGNTINQSLTLVIQCPVIILPVAVLQYMQAGFVVPPSNPPFTLDSYARSCGFDRFNWQQVITALPSGTSFQPNNPAPLIASGNVVSVSGSPSTCVSNWAGCFLVAPPAFNDPPSGGYTYFNSHNPLDNTAFPFYYPQSELSPSTPYCTVHSACPPFPPTVDSANTKLSFVDVPAFSGLPSGSSVAFMTSFVGISDQVAPGSISCGGNGAPYCTTLFSWKWKSTFNGTAGGGSQLAGVSPIDPGSGTGGVTLTNINGTDLPTAVSSDQVSITSSGLAYSRVSQTFNGTVTLTNISSNAISGPLQILFTGMTSGVTLVSATANLTGTPYLTVPGVTVLNPGQSVTVSIQFRNPSNALISFTPAIYAGVIN